ncbi:hypothetical protein FKP32DRAFT_1586289 [Trametes sanguinea]|nr:hypothetical protein FKP32DRAFT_1586289 [Trametes sanguinea]
MAELDNTVIQASTLDRDVDDLGPDSDSQNNSDSDSDSDSLPDVSQLIQQDRHRRQGRDAADNTAVEPKLEDDDGAGQALHDSAGLDVNDGQSVGSSSTAPTTNPPTTSKSSRRPSKRASVPRKRAMDSDAAGEEMQAFASQPPPRSSKRARPSLQPPPATQPLPSTPVSSSKPAPLSSTKKKGAHRTGTTLRKRSANYWHLDGSVVVQVQDTLFRLHRSRLAQQSDFFAALFRNNDGSSDSPVLVEEDTVDNCPVYVISGVSVLDFERLLTALDAGIDLDKLPGVKEGNAAAATQTVLLAQDCDLPELLKPAYYELLRTPGFGQDLSVYLHAESSDASYPAARLKMESDEDEQNAPSPTLPASDFVRLVNAKQVLQREWQALVRAPPLPSTFVCPLSKISPFSRDGRTRDALVLCQRAWLAEEAQWYSWVMPTGLFELGMIDVFAGMRRLIDIDWQAKGFCLGCVSERRDAWAAKRRALWDKLDVLLGLKGEDGH